MVKRSIEQEIRNKNFGNRNGNFEKKRRGQESRGQKQRVQRILGDCWQWENQRAVCERRQLQFSATISISVEKSSPSNPSPNSFMRQSERKTHRGPEVPEVTAPVVECHDGLARITSEELATTHSVKNGTLQNACFYKTESGCRFGEKLRVRTPSG